jgi:8-oxo-dGTP diphosphatase
VASGDGNGWVACRCGDRHWGRHGAAGLLLWRGRGDDPEVLLQLRAGWTHQGGTWGIPGGATDSHETPREAALREAFEESGVRAQDVRVQHDLVTTDHGDWRYVVVVAAATGSARPHAANAESDRVEWVAVDAVAALDLHPGLAGSWPVLRGLLSGTLPAR